MHELGEATGIAVLGSGDVVVFHRAGRVWMDPFPSEPIAAPTLWCSDGRRFGAGMFVMPHGLCVDHRGHLWVTDLGRAQVIELSPEGVELRAFGGFDQPTDVRVRDDGSFVVSDGYRRGDLVELDPAGRVRGRLSGLRLPHGIAVDGDRVYVAERGHARIAVVEGGRIVAEWRGEELGRPYGVAIAADGSVYAVGNGLAHLDREGRVLAHHGEHGHAVAIAGGVVHVVDTYHPRLRSYPG